MENGVDKGDRTGTGTRSVFGRQMRFNLADGFPLVTTKQVHTRSIIYELLFFLSGLTNRSWLNDQGVTIWDNWGDKYGNLGPIYSHQWRNFGGRHANRPKPVQKLPPNPTVHNVASQGTYTKGDGSETDDKLLQTWRGMIARCYNSNKDTSKYYGSRGVFVCDDWLVFDNFRRDAKTLDGWCEKEKDWSGYGLDKDLIGDGFCYGPQTTVWASKTENASAKIRYVYHLRHVDGREVTVRSQRQFYESHGISQGNFSAMLRGERNIAGGWSLVEKIDTWKGIDQLGNVLNALKTNPNDRRMLVSAWNPSDVPYMALPPCHSLFQFYVAEGKLSCQMYQRSCDYFLGVPFNIASYALLTSMMAQMAGLHPGEFIWVGGDVHIYRNHFEQVERQWQRSPFDLPWLKLENRGQGLDDWQYSDIAIMDYKHHKPIKAPVAV